MLSGDTISTLVRVQYCGVYLQYIGGCSLLWGIYSVLWRNTVGKLESSMKVNSNVICKKAQKFY